MLEKTVRILMVEDLASDAEIEIRELHRNGLAIETCIVETEGDFRRELDAFRPDVILSDFSLPGFSGMAALGIARELRPDVPFIFVSGTIGEESAVAALRNGATDYVLKTNLRRLSAAVHRAVVEAEEKRARMQAEDRIRMLQAQFSMFMNHLPAAAFAKDTRGRFVFANPTFEAMIGRSAEELLGKSTADLYPPEYVEAITANDRKVMHDGEPHRAVERVNFGGEDRHFLVSKFPILEEDGKVVLMGGIGLDITDRLQMEQALKVSEERFRGIVETTEERLWECDLELRMTYNNPALTRILGYLPAEVAGRSALDLLDEQGHGAQAGAMRQRMASRSGWRGVLLKARHKDGTVRWLESNGMPLFGEGGELSGFRGADRDVTQRTLQEQALKRLSRIREVLGSFSSAILRLRQRDELLQELCRIAVEVGGMRMAWAGLVDEHATQLTPVAAHGAIESFLSTLDLRVASRSAECETLAAVAVRQISQQIVNDIERSGSTPGRWRENALQRGYRAAAALPFVAGNRVVAVGVLFAGERDFFNEDQIRLLADLSADASIALERIEKQDRIDYLSYYDTVSGIANRALLLERLLHFQHEAGRGERKFALMILDIERFRLVNESLGRSAGDGLLKAFAERMKALHDAERIARVAMNSFAVVLPNVDDALHASRLVEDARRALLATPFTVDERELRVAARCGVAIFPDDGTDPESLIRNAEAALARAKQEGEATVYYTPRLNADVAQRLSLENKLREALEHRRFVLHYQPKVSLATGAIEGVEALLRWNDPDSGLVPPSQFIPILEETGMILDVGKWALSEAASVFSRWRSMGIGAARIAVNVSQIQLRQRDFVDYVRDLLHGHGPEAGIDIEITESMVMQDIGRSTQILTALRSAGTRIAMDDFGTGYSSLSYLARLPIDALKIDRSFVKTITERQDDVEIASAIISMAKSLNLTTIAEGVETREQYDLLRELGCQQVQGYFVSRPLPEQDIVRMLDRRA
ncbi:MAG TPA: EAL domain-containing protein [Burkholderiales bacterium]|nr:EAL domain-containing protein [Burkholderiales bacterium]